MGKDNIYERQFIEPLFDPIHPDTIFGKKVRLGHYVVIEKGCKIGDYTFIGNFCVLREGTVLGKKCVVGHGTVFEGKCIIGNHVLIHAQCHITKGVVIEDDVFIAPMFVGANTPKIVHGRNYPLVLKPYRIKRAARIGVGVVILPGVTVGENAMIAAGTVVTKDVPDRSIVMGVPGRIVGNVPNEELL